MDFFFFSKILWAYFNPVNILLYLLLIVIFLSFFTKKKLFKFLNVITLFLFITIIILPTGKYFFWKLEKSYSIPKNLPNKVDGILILGGGMNEHLTHQYQQINLNNNVDRLTESILLIKKFPDAKVVFSGGIATFKKPKLTGAEVAKMFYERMGVDVDKIIFEDKSRNTYENFIFSKKYIVNNSNEKWLLITSASHMKRAMSIAKKLKLDFLPYPVDFYLEKDFLLDEWYRANYSENIEYFKLASYEYLGLIVYFLSGRSSKIY